VGSLAAEDAPRLNVVFFLVDDFGAHDLASTGSPLYETPRIDRLAADSTRFSQAYAAYPRCVPSRFAMMTGVHPSRAEGLGEALGNIEPARVTVAEALKEQGYATFFAGKWHLGKEPARLPQGQGFDINIAGGSAGEPGSYFLPYGTSRRTGPETLTGPDGEYLTDRLTEETVQFIRSHRDGPFFVYLSHYAVHTPLQGKADKVDHYKQKVASLKYEGDEYETGPDGRHLRRQNNATYAAMIESVDESLGRIVDTLTELGLYERTIIVFTSDHGGLSNSGRENKRELATTNLPLRAGKGHMYEGGIRVPVFVRWPGVSLPGSSVAFPITGMDYYPSILEMAGLPLRPKDHTDGVSFAPGLRDAAGFGAGRTFFWYSDRGRVTSTGDLNAAVIRRGSHKLIEFFNEGRVELYDLASDPGEQHDIAAAQPELRDALLADLRAWKTEMKVRDREQQTPRAGERYED
jgi:arylsulfatase A-like enzyme